MKFAKEIEEDLVPEWRVKYLNYKQGKKKIKAVSRALRSVQQTPTLGGPRRPSDLTPLSARLTFTNYDFTPATSTQSDKKPLRDTATPGKSSQQDAVLPNTLRFAESPPNVPLEFDGTGHGTGTEQGPGQGATQRQSTSSGTSSQHSVSPNSKPVEDVHPEPNVRPEVTRLQSKTTFTSSPPMRISETQPLKGPYDTSRAYQAGVPRYGSIIGSPPERVGREISARMPSLELPDPAMPNPDKRSRRSQGFWKSSNPPAVVSGQTPSRDTDAYHVGQTHVPHKSSSIGLPRHMFQSKRAFSTPSGNVTTPRPLIKRLFTVSPVDPPAPYDMQLNAYRDLDAKQEQFFAFLDKELEKVDSFYKMKEGEATHRLHVLREQLHEMRDRRVQEMMAAKIRENEHSEGVLANLLTLKNRGPNGNGDLASILKPAEDALRRGSRIGKTSQAMGQLGSPVKSRKGVPEDQQDYTRRRTDHVHVPYRTAKRKLKLALQEFYRGLELLKSYAMLNRTGFRKINKKYDKAVNARPTLRYMSEKVNKAWFVQSDVIEGHIVAVEDLYARYFERGNHKVAVSKLRSYSKVGNYSSNSFRNGLFLAGGLVLGIQGIVYGAGFLHSPDPVVALQSSYLFQLYAGYFLGLLLFLTFVLACRLWSRAKVNYVFIFEYDTRHVLDWRQLAELPCFFLFLNGLFLWLNFRPGSSDSMFLYWPVALIGITLLILCLPVPILYPNARKWWGYSNWRLLLAGLYPVEFRDFFIGDMYCSETYAMGNIELFFCLYAQNWSNPPQCNSNHSRLLGFFAALPAVWRAFQCIRRYYDSGNWFPHLANCAKYACNILYYMSLSLYRMDESSHLHGLFIFFATVNAVYCSFWDVAMDWSLGNPYARHPFLRDNLAYRQVWMYYVAMVLDPILRFQWIFYALYAHNVQHSTKVSFFVSLAEVFRRSVWMLFRVENEHCNNVGRFRASRDVPLPYTLPESPKESQEFPRNSDEQALAPAASTGTDVEASPQTQASSLRLRRTRTPAATPVERAMRRAGTILGTAHAQDYEKKKRPGMVGNSPELDGAGDDDEDSDDDGEASDGQMSPNVAEEEDEVMQVQKVLSRTGQNEQE